MASLQCVYGYGSVDEQVVKRIYRIHGGNKRAVFVLGGDLGNDPPSYVWT